MTLKPVPPFVWPEARVITGVRMYERHPPWENLALTATALIGIGSALTACGIELLESWLAQNSGLSVRLIVVVYPACATHQSDLYRLLRIVEAEPGRVSVQVRPLEGVTDRMTTALCFVGGASDAVHMVSGAFED